MSSDLHTLLLEAERSFRKACEQIVQLNRRLDDMAKRYDKASRENHRSFRYSLRLRMAVTEGVRNMYYEYAANKADEITHLRCQVRDERAAGENVVDVDDDGGDVDGEARGESNYDLDIRPVDRLLRSNAVLPNTSASGDDDNDSVSDMEDDEVDETGDEVDMVESETMDDLDPVTRNSSTSTLGAVV